MGILEAFDLTRSLRYAADDGGLLRQHGGPAVRRARRRHRAQPARIGRTLVFCRVPAQASEQCPVEDSKGNIRADVAHEKRASMGFTGYENVLLPPSGRPGQGRLCDRPAAGAPAVSCSRTGFVVAPATSATARSRCTGRRRCCSARGSGPWTRHRIVIGVAGRHHPDRLRLPGCHVSATGRDTVKSSCSTDNEKSVTIRTCRPHPGPQPFRSSHSAGTYGITKAHLSAAGPGFLRVGL